MNALFSAHPVVCVSLAVVSKIPAEGGTGHTDRHNAQGHPCGHAVHILFHQGTKDYQQGDKLKRLEDTPQQFKGHALVPGSLLISGKPEEAFIGIKHGLHPLPSGRCLWPVYEPSTSADRVGTAPEVPYVFRYPKSCRALPQQFDLLR